MNGREKIAMHHRRHHHRRHQHCFASDADACNNHRDQESKFPFVEMLQKLEFLEKPKRTSSFCATVYMFNRFGICKEYCTRRLEYRDIMCFRHHSLLNLSGNIVINILRLFALGRCEDVLPNTLCVVLL